MKALKRFSSLVGLLSVMPFVYADLVLPGGNSGGQQELEENLGGLLESIEFVMGLVLAVVAVVTFIGGSFYFLLGKSDEGKEKIIQWLFGIFIASTGGSIAAFIIGSI